MPVTEFPRSREFRVRGRANRERSGDRQDVLGHDLPRRSAAKRAAGCAGRKGWRGVVLFLVALLLVGCAAKTSFVPTGEPRAALSADTPVEVFGPGVPPPMCTRYLGRLSVSKGKIQDYGAALDRLRRDARSAGGNQLRLLRVQSPLQQGTFGFHIDAEVLVNDPQAPPVLAARLAELPDGLAGLTLQTAPLSDLATSIVQGWPKPALFRDDYIPVPIEEWRVVDGGYEVVGQSVKGFRAGATERLGPDDFVALVDPAEGLVAGRWPIFARKDWSMEFVLRWLDPPNESEAGIVEPAERKVTLFLACGDRLFAELAPGLWRLEELRFISSQGDVHRVRDLPEIVCDLRPGRWHTLGDWRLSRKIGGLATQMLSRAADEGVNWSIVLGGVSPFGSAVGSAIDLAEVAAMRAVVHRSFWLDTGRDAAAHAAIVDLIEPEMPLLFVADEDR